MTHTTDSIRNRLTLTTAILGLFVFSLLESMIAPALPSIRAELNITPTQVGWVFTGLLLSGAVSTALIGRLADLYEKRWVFCGVMTIASLGVVLAALADSITFLAIGQALQGVGFGLVPLCLGLVKELMPRDRASFGVGMVMVAICLSTLLGLLIAGTLVANFGYQAIYWLPLLALIGCTLVMVVLQQGSDLQPASHGDKQVDWLGGFLLAVSLSGLLLALTLAPDEGWTAFPVLGLFAVFAVGMSLWVAHEKRTSCPLVDLTLLQDRRVYISAFIAFAVGFCSLSAYVLVPLFVQADPAGGYGLGATVEQIGMYLVPFGIASSAIAPLVSRLERLTNPRLVMILGMLALVLGLLLLALMDSSRTQVLIAMTLIGLGTGLALSEMLSVVVRTVSIDRAAGISGLMYVIRNIGATTGAQLSVTMLGVATDTSSGTTAFVGYQWALFIAMGIGALAVLAAICFPTSAADEVRSQVPDGAN
ncbi:MFS transporter [Phytopseudomonas daroniae]|uniref:MFS transporter n=1 Tax=Phytopseudomonas daroniae TaxID=2487519 RepID=UPI0010383662|nr:MFS transporter [Pseudomonas daroniae]TBU77239.1 hypothetical protein DNK10_06955 [Pseudomonas daroniae]